MGSTSQTPNIRVVAIGGSLRDDSYTRLALRIALEGAQETNAETRLLNLKDYNLSFADLYGNDNPGVKEMRIDVRQAHGIILGTPEYHGSFSGVLKHALDLMGFREFESKMVGLVGVAGGRMGAIDSLAGLRIVGRSLHAWVVPEQVSIPEVWNAFDEADRIKDSTLEDALKEVGRQVARFAALHNSEQYYEFKRLWESSQPNPGGHLSKESEVKDD
jgi:NAD(P)H-dependent FMN reductase